MRIGQMAGTVWSRMTAGAIGGALALTGLATVSAAAAEPGPVPDGTRRAVFVGNNWGGTADILAPDTLRRLGTIDVVPDYDERMQEILSDPYRMVYFLAIRTLIGEGHDQLV